jgi:HD-GYP domain-containing protein (c-di-GMP phosphodiesterase class II)
MIRHRTEIGQNRGFPLNPGIVDPDRSALRLSSAANVLERLEQLNQVGIALSKERDTNRLLETIISVAKDITNADGGTLYRVTENRTLAFEILRTDSLGLAMGGTTGIRIPFDPVPLYDLAGKRTLSNVVSYAYHYDTSLNIADAYTQEGFDFSGTKNMDRRIGYRSKSFLTVPMKNHENEIIGVLQLLNATDPATGIVGEFSIEDQQLVESLASQAAIALTNRLLITHLEHLFESLIRLINRAIGEKSPHTGQHCDRVPVLTMMLADAVSACKIGPLKDFTMTEKDRYELKIAGLLHDCGKITTPVHIVEKATKLQTLYDRIETLDTRFEVLKRDAEIVRLRAELIAVLKGDTHAAEEAGDHFTAKIRQIEEDREFLRTCNVGSENMIPSDEQRVSEISSRYRWRNVEGIETDFLTPDELENLTIRSGTLTAAERQIINHHIDSTIHMLEALPWPQHLKKVPEYAGGHHERMDGKGYPRGLTREQMSIQARCMGVADIFEALTAKERPYKQGKTLSESLEILGKLKLSGHIDPDLFDVFIWEGVYLKYAQKYMDPNLIDDVDLSKIPGYTPPPISTEEPPR